MREWNVILFSIASQIDARKVETVIDLYQLATQPTS